MSVGIQWSRWWDWGVLFSLVLSLAVVAFNVWMYMSLTARTTRATCDQAVATLVSTDSLVELERAKFLIEKLDCSVKRRLPEVG